MRASRAAPVPLEKAQARRIWLHAQRLDTAEPFGDGPAATPAAIRHLGYVQIDTINVIERCHHHILYTRIPSYRREHLHRAQSVDKSVFEYWTHALSYVPVEDMRFFIHDMRKNWVRRSAWFAGVKEKELRKVLWRIRNHGALTIRDITDDVLVEKDHEWASRKPSKRAMQFAFFRGLITVSQRAGMLKTYDLTARHFGWTKMPASAAKRERLDYLLDRALRSQGVISPDSICYLIPSLKPDMQRVIEKRVRRGELLPVAIDGAEKIRHWARPETLESIPPSDGGRVHILSPFDPIINQRKRVHLLFDYEHLFEAYVPKSKRRFGYFVCPVLMGDRVVAGLDLKTDREHGKLLVQKWNWFGKRSDRAPRAPIEEALQRFEQFQLAKDFRP